jgi:hypothetical protein
LSIPKQCIALAVLLAAQSSANAQAVAVSSVSSATVVETCRNMPTPMAMPCAGYILGVFDTLTEATIICPPQNLDSLSAQAVAVGLKYLKDHPELWHFGPSYLLRQGFVAAFACHR